jgi:hypothetical protein
MSKLGISFAAIVLFGVPWGVCRAQANDPAPLPADFPVMTAHIYDANAIADGYVFLAVAANVAGVGNYLMILDNDGTPIWYQEAADDEIYDFKVLSNGLLHYAPFIQAHSYTGGGDVIHTIMDEQFQVVEEITPGSGYVGEGHDFQLLPNGHALFFCYYMTQVDMSKLTLGGYPNALVSGAVIQELDGDRNVVFQWRTWDHFPFEPSGSAVTAAWHLNSIFQDTDGHIVFGTPVEVKKINRQTGELMWCLGGSDNEFTFVGDGADPSQIVGHNFHRLDNGNVLVYDNGDRQGKRPSQVHEYALDEVNKIATHVWSYVPDEKIPAWHRGSAQRLPNGNTLIGWGGANGKVIPAATEVTPEGRKVWELYFDNPNVESYRAFRFVFPSDRRRTEVTDFELAVGNTYRFADTEADTGMTIRVMDRIGDGYNEVTVRREPYAPVYPSFPGKSPRVLPLRVTVDQYAIESMTADISFDADSFGFKDPNSLTVYYRPFPGHGLFIPLPTEYNWVTKQLQASMNAFGEFVFGYPDLADVALPPLLNEPENYRGVQRSQVGAPMMARPDVQYTVNQALPISLSWSPTGLARGYELQIAETQDFTAPVVDLPDQTEASYIWQEAAPTTTYYYRVRTRNEDGTSEWSIGSFRTVPPMLKVTVPNGGEQWQRGRSYFIQWEDNINEDVVIELYQGDVPAKVLATVSSTGAYNWQVPLNIQAGDDYSIKIRSAVDETMTDESDTVFTIK